MDLEKAYNKIDNFCCSNHNSLQGNTVRYLNGREEKINMFSDYQETKDDDFCKDADEMVEALETIKELVDLQKEISSPLDVVVKVLEIIKEYQVDVWLLKQCDYETYLRIRKEAMVSVGQIVNENGIVLEDEITKEYFDLVKRWV